MQTPRKNEFCKTSPALSGLGVAGSSLVGVASRQLVNPGSAESALLHNLNGSSPTKSIGGRIPSMGGKTPIGFKTSTGPSLVRALQGTGLAQAAAEESFRNRSHSERGPYQGSGLAQAAVEERFKRRATSERGPYDLLSVHGGSENEDQSTHMSSDGWTMNIDAEDTLNASLCTDFAQLSGEGMYSVAPGAAVSAKLQEAVKAKRVADQEFANAAEALVKHQERVAQLEQSLAQERDAMVKAQEAKDKAKERMDAAGKLVQETDAEEKASFAKEGKLLQCLQNYGFKEPNPIQQKVIPAILYYMGKQLGGHAGGSTRGSSFITIQGSSQIGKTSAVVVGMLAALDPALAMPQVIFLSTSSRLDVDRFMRVFTLMQDIQYVAFNKDESAPNPFHIDKSSAEVKAARTAHVIIGHPKRILRLLSSIHSICLDSVHAIVVDDADEMLFSGEDATLFSTDVIAETAPVTPETRSGSSVDDVVHIVNVIECRRYAQNMSETYAIRSGRAPKPHLRHVLITQPVMDDSATGKALRMFKTALKNGNRVGIANVAPHAKLMKSMKHYYAVAPSANWTRLFAGFVQSLLFSRALIFCDDGRIEQYLQELQGMGISISANAPQLAKGSETAADVRRRAVQDFSASKTQFLLTTSEPAICQTILPKVSCVFHFGLPLHMPAVYGVRLMPIDGEVMKESSSILLIEESAQSGSSVESRTAATSEQVSTAGKIFDISFTDMPWEFLPATCSGIKR